MPVLRTLTLYLIAGSGLGRIANGQSSWKLLAADSGVASNPRTGSGLPHITATPSLGLWITSSDLLLGSTVAETSRPDCAMVARSKDGTRWTQLFRQCPGNFVDLVQFDATLVVALDDGIYRSTDEGSHWAKVNFDATRTGRPIGLFKARGKLFVTIWTNATPRPTAALFSSMDYGSTWSKTGDLLFVGRILPSDDG